MGLLNDLGAELIKAKKTIEPQIEGLHDFASLDIKDETKAVVAVATTDFERRRDLIKAALKALDDLDADHYPDVPIRDVVQDVFNDLQDNVDTIEAAFAKFAPINEAVKAIITPGIPKEQP